MFAATMLKGKIKARCLKENEKVINVLFVYNYCFNFDFK